VSPAASSGQSACGLDGSGAINEEGAFRGRAVARVFVAADGSMILVGKNAEDNDILTTKLARPNDFWFHVAGHSGAHVVVRNPSNLKRLSRETKIFAASLAAGYSTGSGGGRVAVHFARCSDVAKPRGMAPGKVTLRRYEVLQVKPHRGEVAGAADAED